MVGFFFNGPYIVHFVPDLPFRGSVLGWSENGLIDLSDPEFCS